MGRRITGDRVRLRVSRGFTLIELLVVFTLLGLLLTIAAPRYFHVVEESREKARGQNLATLRDAIDKFRADQGRFPGELAELVTKQYLRQIPIDPVSGSSDWVKLGFPSGVEQGIYDVAPPDGQTQPVLQDAAAMGVTGAASTPAGPMGPQP